MPAHANPDAAAHGAAHAGAHGAAHQAHGAADFESNDLTNA